ncbi:ribosome hibernation-promoting factor, HPF/YfiA family [Chloroflexota bacterium]
MELRITGKNVEITPPVRTYVEKKLTRLGRHFSAVTDCEVVLSEEGTKSLSNRFVVEVTANAKGTILRAEERGNDLFKAIDRTAKVMKRQVDRYKGKLYERNRGISPGKAFAEQLASETNPEETSSSVVKVKRHFVKPMSVSEAREQMELLGHDFYLFLNSSSQEVNVIYRRRDGDFGIIEPEFG